MSLSSNRAPVAQFEIEIAHINENAESLTQDKNRVSDVESIGKQQHAPADGKEPECNRYDHSSRPLRGNPLHRKAHGEHELRHIAEHYPPLEFGDEYFVEVVADRVGKINQHCALPPKPAAAGAGG